MLVGRAAHGVFGFRSLAFWSHSAFLRSPSPSSVHSPCFLTIRLTCRCCPFDCRIKSPISTPLYWTSPTVPFNLSPNLVPGRLCRLSPLIQLKAFRCLAFWASGQCFINHRQSVEFRLLTLPGIVHIEEKYSIQINKIDRTLGYKNILIKFLSLRGQRQLICHQTEMKICDRFSGNWCASLGA